MSDATRILQEQPSDCHPMVAYHKMTDLSTIEMSGQKYKRTNFEDDDNTSMGGTPPGITYDPAIAFKVGAGFWQKRTNMERLLLVASLIMGIVVVILSAMVASHQHKDLCMTKSCITVASTVINSIDSSTDPCDDFYQYACGGWIDKHPIPSGQSRWGTFSDMWRQNQLVLKNELEKPLNESKSEAEKKARLYYQSCMDENKTVEKLGPQPLIDLLNDLGCWNVTCPNFDGASWDFTALLKKLHSLGLSVFFNTWIGEDEKNSNKNILQFDQDGLGLARDQYMNKTIKEDKTLSAYLKFMVDIGELLGGDRNETERLMMEVILFEQQLANITIPQEERRDDMQLYHKITLAEMNTLAPFMDWVDYVNTLLKVTKFNVTAKEKIVVFAPEFLRSASALITQMNSTAEGRNTLNNYMLWHLVKLMASYLSKPFREAKKEFSEVLSGSIGYEEDWRYCTTDTDGTIGFALGAMFVRAAFKGNSKQKAESMIQEIKDAFKKNLPKLKWMDEDTRKAAVDKANAVIDMIGFPGYILNATEIDKRYEQLEIKSEEYFLNNLRDLKFNMRRNLEKLRKAPDKTSWSMTPPTVNAYYTPTKNEIVFPAGILQAPFYSPDYPKSLNFGGMGVVMGHELTHGFDDQGREYDKHGILRPWWNNASIDRFIERTKCMVDQYSKFSINGDHVRGKQTLGENIADNGGLKSAYNAYVHYTKVHGEEDPLPGVSLTHRQLFFVAFAQVWCSNSKPQSDHMAIITDPHSPAKFRVIGPLTNSKEFAENFKCPAGKNMNPVNKCEVW